MNPVHYSSNTVEWATPDSFFKHLSSLFNIQLDPCATQENAKALRYYTAQENGLAQSWKLSSGAVFMNPPYGRGISAWVKKAYETAKEGTQVICLLPARTDTKWWQQYCTQGLVHFIKGRLKFGGSKFNAPFPCAIVIFTNFNGASA
jgi:phage N-6-adenine-methyltransferase